MRHTLLAAAAATTGAFAPAAAWAAPGDLMPPLASRTFDAISMRGTSSADGTTTTGSVTQQAATIRWDATSRSWTLKTNGGTITFTPANIDSAQSSSAATAYLKSQGSQSDSLTVTKAGLTGRLTYRYVGTAFWQNTRINGTSGRGALDALVYGFATAFSKIPKQGTAAYAVDLIGAESIPSGVGALVGEGTALLDFGKDTIAIDGTLSAPYFGSDLNWSASGKLTADANSFSGSISWYDAATFTGTFTGKLFGPRINEFGAVFSAKAPDGRIGVGTITGRKGNVGNPNFTTQPLPNPQVFATSEAVITFNSQYGPQNNNETGNFSGQKLAKGDLSISYTPSGGYRLQGTVAQGYLDQIEVARPNRTYVAEGYALDSIQQTKQYRLSHYVYGMETPLAAVPRTGKGGYDVTFFGHAVDANFRNTMRVDGKGGIIVDFASGAMKLDGALDYAEDFILAGRAADRAKGQITGTATLAADANAFAGTLTLTGLGSYTGTWWGALYGPKAQEIGATFSAADKLSGDSLVGTLSGVSNPALGGSSSTLSDRRVPMTFTLDAVASDLPSGIRIVHPQPRWKWYPASGTYATTDYLPQLAKAYIVADKSDASRTWYAYNRAKLGTLEGYVFKASADNPVIALSYTSFADLSFRGPELYQSAEREFVVFGLQTPDSQIPYVGKGTWKGIARGTGGYDALNWDGGVAGTSTLVADFGNSTAKLTLALRTEETKSRALSPIVFDTLLSSGGNQIWSNDVWGRFYGPSAAEFGVAWKFDQYGVASLLGVAVGKRVK